MSNAVSPQFQGVNKRRYHNPYELKYAQQWERENTIYDKPLLAYLMDPTYQGNVELSERDWLVANTVIQWLGSPMGFEFIAAVLGVELPDLSAYIGREEPSGGQ